MKLSLMKLIANDILNYGLEFAKDSDSSFLLEDYFLEFEENSRKYIRDNLSEILLYVKKSKDVKFIDYDDEREILDITYSNDILLNDVDRIVYEKSMLENVNLDIDDIKEISNSVLNVDCLDEVISDRIRIKSKSGGMEL